MIVSGNYTWLKDSVATGSGVLLALDYADRAEIVAGATLTSCTWHITLAGASASAAWTVGTGTVSGTKARCRLSDLSAAVGGNYHLVCSATLSDGTVLPPESILVAVRQA